MQTIFETEGFLSPEYRGHLSFSVQLPEIYDCLRIRMTFDKQRLPEVLPGHVRLVEEAYIQNYGPGPYDRAMLEREAAAMKTEIQLEAFCSGVFIGGMHRQATDRTMEFSPGYASVGCIPQERFAGALRVNLIVFNVLHEHTRYTLRVEAGKEDAHELAED